MRMEECGFWDGCSAPICPLDGEWHERNHLDGEKVCHHLTQYSKHPLRPILRGGQQGELYKVVAGVYPEIRAAHPPIKRQLDRSSKRAGKLKNWQNFAEAE